MGTTREGKQLMFISVIVNRGMGSKVLHIARQNGLSGGTIALGKGTFNNQFLKTLALNDSYKELVFIVTVDTTGAHFLEILNEKLKLYKPHHGIAFVTAVDYACGSDNLICDGIQNYESEEVTMYQSIYIIVEKGKGESAVESASKAGAGGATIINARGSGAHETSKLFNIEIEPEKEIVMIILKSELTRQVVSALISDLKIDQPGNGIIFVQNLNQVYGLYE